MVLIPTPLIGRAPVVKQEPPPSPPAEAAAEEQEEAIRQPAVEQPFHKQPSGRAPKRKAWDIQTGKWVESTAVAHKRPPGGAPICQSLAGAPTAPPPARLFLAGRCSFISRLARPTGMPLLRRQNLGAR